MLVLSRRPQEKVVLPGLGITIRVVAIQNGRVRIGIEAPPAVAIVREELLSKPRTPVPEHTLSEPCR